MNYANGRNFDFVPSFRDGEFHFEDFARLSESRNTFFSPVWTTTLSFDRTFAGDHNFGAVIGYEVQDFTT